MLLNTNNQFVGTLTIEGTLIISSSISGFTFSAYTIIVNGGTLIIGDRITGGGVTYSIILQGMLSSSQRAIICNSCNLEFNGQKSAFARWSSTVSTTSNSVVTKKKIVVNGISSEIVIGPSENNTNARSISSVSSSSTTP